jgi:GAF domain-containing protein
VLILPRGSEFSIQAEATTRGSSVTVRLRETPLSVLEVPEAIIRYAARTQETVILDDASARNPFSNDDYIRERRPRSVLCLPLVKQGVLVALLPGNQSRSKLLCSRQDHRPENARFPGGHLARQQSSVP